MRNLLRSEYRATLCCKLVDHVHCSQSGDFFCLHNYICTQQLMVYILLYATFVLFLIR